MRATKHSTPVRAVGIMEERLLLRAVSGDAGKPGADATVGSVASGSSGLREPAPDPVAARGGPGDQSQAGGSPAATDGHRGDLPQRFEQSAWRGASDLSVSVRGNGHHGTRPGVVQRHHLYPGAAGLFVSG